MRLTSKALSLVAIGLLAACSGANLAASPGSVIPTTGVGSNQTMTIPCHCTHTVQAGARRLRTHQRK
jgi:hypothetical protein